MRAFIWAIGILLAACAAPSTSPRPVASQTGPALDAVAADVTPPLVSFTHRCSGNRRCTFRGTASDAGGLFTATLSIVGVAAYTGPVSAWLGLPNGTAVYATDDLTVVHTFAQSGTYTVTLSVTDTAVPSNEGSATRTIVVR
jgi:hypothetical protein